MNLDAVFNRATTRFKERYVTLAALSLLMVLLPVLLVIVLISGTLGSLNISNPVQLIISLVLFPTKALLVIVISVVLFLVLTKVLEAAVLYASTSDKSVTVSRAITVGAIRGLKVLTAEILLLLFFVLFGFLLDQLNPYLPKILIQLIGIAVTVYVFVKLFPLKGYIVRSGSLSEGFRMSFRTPWLGSFLALVLILVVSLILDIVLLLLVLIPVVGILLALLSFVFLLVPFASVLYMSFVEELEKKATA